MDSAPKLSEFVDNVVKPALAQLSQNTAVKESYTAKTLYESFGYTYENSFDSKLQSKEQSFGNLAKSLSIQNPP